MEFEKIGIAKYQIAFPLILQVGHIHGMGPVKNQSDYYNSKTEKSVY